jgi:hypothetical protein
VDVRVTPLRTEIIIKATRTQNVLGRCGLLSPGSGSSHLPKQPWPALSFNSFSSLHWQEQQQQQQL